MFYLGSAERVYTVVVHPSLLLSSHPLYSTLTLLTPLLGFW